MSGCLDNVQCECCVNIDWSDKRNAIASVVSGVLFFSGWWIIIDVAAVYSNTHHFANAFYTCGVISTLSFFMINAVSNSHVRGDSMAAGIGVKFARVWLMFGFLLGFGALIAAIWIMFDEYVVHNSFIGPDKKPVTRKTWPGIALFMQNALIFFGSLVYKFGRTEDLWG